MNKDEVLKMSREENEGRHDEREIIAFGTASRAGMLVGALVCVLLVFASELLFIFQKSDWLAGSYILQCKAVAILYCIRT